MTPLSMSAAGPRPWLLVLLLAVVPLWNHPYFEELRSPNPLSRAYLARAIVDHGVVDIDQVQREHGDISDRARRGNHAYCDKAPGSSFLLVPIYAALKAAAPGGKVGNQELLRWGSVFLGVLPTVLGLLCLDLLMVWLGLRSMTRRVALCAWGLGSVGVPFELLFFGHQLAACWVVMALWAGVRAAQAGTIRHGLLAGFCAGWAMITEYPVSLLVLIVAGMVVGVLWQEPVDRARRLVTLVAWVLVGGIIPLGLGMAYHQAAFGGPLTTGYAFIENQYFASIHTRGVMGVQAPTLQGLFGTLLSSNRGLFYFQPYLLLALPGAILLWKRGQRTWSAGLLTAMVVYAAFAAGFGYWLGGWSLGPRHLVPAVPFFLLAFAACLDSLEQHVPPLADLSRGLVGWSVVVIGLACITHSGYPEEFVHPFFQMTVPLAWGGFFPHSLGTAAGWTRAHAAIIPITAWVLTLLVVGLAGRSVVAVPLHRLRAGLAFASTAAFIMVAGAFVDFPNDAMHRIGWIVDTVWEPREGREVRRTDPVKLEPTFTHRRASEDDHDHVGRHYSRSGDPRRALEEFIRGDGAAPR